MSIAANIAIRTAKLAHGIVEIALLFAMLILVAIGCFALWDSNQLYRAAAPVQYELYKPTAGSDGLSFAELQAINPEVFGWLTVYGTNIDYPLVQNKDNLKYVNTNAKGRYSLSGAVFLDCNSSTDFSDFSSIIHAHHMDKEVMFGQIGLFSEKSYFDARQYGVLYFDGQEQGIEFFAFLHTNAYDTAVFRTKITAVEEQEAYLDLLLGMAKHTRNIAVSTNDRIVLLATCSQSSTNGRDLLVGRITSEVMQDPFAEEGQRIDGFSSLWEQAPLWGKIVAVGLPLALLLWLVIALKRRRDSRKKGSVTMPDKGDEDTWQQ
ncbi:MAG: class B sortase [Coriobacteriia bacterium]|nr:class B sortase [Coriobacteriia bacterium]